MGLISNRTFSIKRLKCFLFIFLHLVVILLPLAIGAQTLQFNNYTTTDGLITNEVYNLHQDKKGYIWVFSKFGTVKYNGTEFKPVLKNLPFKDSFIFSIYENKDGKKWVANSKARIYEIRNDSAFIINGIEEVSSALRNSVNEIIKLYVDDSLNIYAITKGKSYKLLKRGNNYFPVDLTREITTYSARVRILDVGTNIIHVVDHFNDYDFAFGTKKRETNVDLCYRGKIYRFPVDEFLSPRHFKKFGEDIYFSIGTKLRKVANNQRLELIEFETHILNFTKDENGHLWVACLNQGLYELNEKDSVINHYLEKTTVNDVLFDAQSGLWASTPGLGLFRCENLKSWHYHDDEPLGKSINFIKKIDNKLFVSNAKGSIFMFHDGKATEIRKADNQVVLNITRHKDDYLVALLVGVETISLRNGVSVKTLRTRSEKQYHVFSKSTDTTIFVWRRGISFSVNDELAERIDFNQKILAAELVDNVLWLGTENGAFPYKPVLTLRNVDKDGVSIPVRDTLVEPAWMASIKDHPVVEIVNDNIGNLWFCTEDKGLFRLRGNLLTNYDMSSGLPGNIVNNINFNNARYALLSTNKGLFLSKPNRAEGTYTEWKKVFSGEIENAVFFEDKMYVKSKNNLVVLDYKPDDKFDKKIFFNLAAILINSKEVNPDVFENVPDSRSSVEFKFDIITSEHTKPPVKYALQGPVSDSGMVSDAFIKFDRLKPGTYTLTSSLITPKGEQLPIIMSFSVIPAFWETSLFYVLVIAALIALIILVVRIYIRYNRRKEEVRYKNEQLIAEYKLIALKAQVNPHFMSNCLAAIQSLVRDNKSERATFYIARFGLLVRKILEYSSKQVITLAEELELLEIYLELEQLRFETKFIYRIEIVEGISKKDVSIPPLLLNPVVENAVWHGMLPMQDKKQGQLLISIARKDEILAMTIEDNGPGRNRDEIQGGESTGSYGTGLTQQRLQNLNFKYKTDVARMVYDDLVDGQGKPEGTRVTIYIPLILIYDEQD